MKKALQAKGILLGMLLLLMAIVSTVVVFQLRAKQADTESQHETP